MTSRLLTTLALIAASLGCSGSDGDQSVVSFTPHTCGRVGCDFANGIAVGGTVGLHIIADGGVSTSNLEVASSDSSTMTVTEVPDVGGRATWQLDAIAAGTLELQVIDRDTLETVDQIEIDMVPINRLGLERFIGTATGPSEAAGFDESWSIAADQPVSFRVTPFDPEGSPLMGQFDYQVSIDDEIADGLIDTSLSEGRLHFRVVAGAWTASWDDGTRTFDAQIVAE